MGLQAELGLFEERGVGVCLRSAKLKGGWPVLEHVVKGDDEQGDRNRSHQSPRRLAPLAFVRVPRVPAHQRQGGEESEPWESPSRIEPAILPILHPEGQRDQGARREGKCEGVPPSSRCRRHRRRARI